MGIGGGGIKMAVVPNSPYTQPSFVPAPGVYISANGRVSIFDNDDPPKEYELLRIQRAMIRISNNVAGYAQTGSQTVITYANDMSVSGSISRAYMNFTAFRLVNGIPNEVSENFGDLLSLKSGKSGGGILDVSRYPTKKLAVGVAINEQLVQGEVEGIDKAFMIKANWCLFDNAQIAYNSRNLIREDGLRFLSSFPTFELIEVSDPPTSPVSTL
jgi:hypothetical protein